MKRPLIVVTLLAALIGLGMAAPVTAVPNRGPVFSGAIAENDKPVQQVRDAITEFEKANRQWPVSIEQLTVFAKQNGMALDVKAFAEAQYYVVKQGTASVAVFEFTMAGAGAQGAFAMTRYDVK